MSLHTKCIFLVFTALAGSAAGSASGYSKQVGNIHLDLFGVAFRIEEGQRLPRSATIKRVLSWDSVPAVMIFSKFLQGEDDIQIQVKCKLEDGERLSLCDVEQIIPADLPRLFSFLVRIQQIRVLKEKVLDADKKPNRLSLSLHVYTGNRPDFSVRPCLPEFCDKR